MHNGTCARDHIGCRLMMDHANDKANGCIMCMLGWATNRMCVREPLCVVCSHLYECL